MSGKSLLAEIEAAALKPGASRALKRYADIYFEQLLEYNGLPEEYFDVVAAVLTRPSLFGVSGAEMFLYQTYASIDEVSEDQRARLLTIIREGFGGWQNEALCYVAGDFVARVYPTTVTTEAATAMLQSAISPQQIAGVRMLVDIISRSSDALHNPEVNRLQEAVSRRTLPQ